MNVNNNPTIKITSGNKSPAVVDGEARPVGTGAATATASQFSRNP